MDLAKRLLELLEDTQNPANGEIPALILGILVGRASNNVQKSCFCAVTAECRVVDYREAYRQILGLVVGALMNNAERVQRADLQLPSFTIPHFN